MNEVKTICICGGGGQCHAIAPWLAKQGYRVNILTNRPELWSHKFRYFLPDKSQGETFLNVISSNPEDVIPEADVILLTVPGFMNAEELTRIKPFLKSNAFVGGVFSSNGFFFEAFTVLGDTFPLWGFQRVPFIGKIKEYGKEGNILAYKPAFQIAVENCNPAEKEEFRGWVERAFGSPTQLLMNYLAVTLSNSNPILHPSRIYTWLKDWNGELIESNPLFYEQWPIEASEAYIELDKDLHKIIKALPVNDDCLPTVLEYYEQHDAESLTEKIRSIESFRNIRMPVKECEGGFLPDFSSRYFIEDFEFGLKKYRELAHMYCVDVPFMDKVFQWGSKILEYNLQ